MLYLMCFFFFQAEDGIRDRTVTGVQTCALPISAASSHARSFLMPSISAMAANGMDGYTVHWHVPIDDSHHWRYVIAVRRDAPITDDDARRNGAEAAPRYRIERDEVI